MVRKQMEGRYQEGRDSSRINGFIDHEPFNCHMLQCSDTKNYSNCTKLIKTSKQKLPYQ